MSDLQIAWMELESVGGIGAILVLAGVMIVLLRKRKNASCTDTARGSVIQYRFLGEGRMYPVVEYTVHGKSYQVRKRFRGIKTRQVSGLPIPVQSKAYEDEKGWLHIQMGTIVNLRRLAEQIWPYHSEMTVYYNPDHPQKSYVDRPIASSFESMLLIIMGLVTIAISVLVFFLIQL